MILYKHALILYIISFYRVSPHPISIIIYARHLAKIIILNLHVISTNLYTKII